MSEPNYFPVESDQSVLGFHSHNAETFAKVARAIYERGEA